MTAFFLNILEITVGMSVLVLVMLLALRLFGSKFTSKCRYVLWMLVLVRLAIPFSLNVLPAMIEVPIIPPIMENAPHNVELNDPVSDLTPNENLPSDIVGSTDTPSQTIPTTPATPTTPVDPIIPITPITPIEPTNPSTPSTEPDPPVTIDPPKEEIVPPDPVTETPSEPVSLTTVLDIVAVIYVAGAVAFFAWNMLSYLIYTNRIIAASRPADERTVAVFRSICEKEKLSRTPTLLVSSEINSPAAFGIFRRKVVLPDIEFSQNGLAGTLFHEVVHCKRGDLFIKLAELIARSLHWFNPLVHIASVRCEMEMEMSCDEKVLAGVSDDARVAYGRVMLDIIRRCRRSRGALTTHFNPKKNSVKSRFENIINGSGSRKGRALIAICLVLCVIAGAIIACTVEVAPDIKEYKINVLVDEEISDGGHNRNVHIIEVDVDSEHKAKINETISEFFLEKYNWYMEMEGGEVAYQLIDTTYDVRGNILGITGISRFTATSVPPCYVQTVFYDLENDKLCTLDEYFAAAGLDMARAKAQVEKYLVTDNYYDTTEYEILSVVYPDGKPVLVVKFTETSMAVEQPETVRLIGYDFDKYSVTWINQSFAGFDAIEWTDIPVHLTVSDLAEPTTGEYGFSVTLTSNVDVKNVQITELIADDFKITDCVPLYSVDLEAGKPITVEASKPGVLGKHGITYAEGSLIKRYEITLSGEDGSPILVPITSDRLADNFKGSDDPNYEIPPIDTTKYVNVLENKVGLEFSTIVIPKNDFISCSYFDEEYVLVSTYDVERDENNQIKCYSDFTFYLINTMTGTLVDYVNLGDLPYRPISHSYTANGLILSDWHLDDEGNMVNLGAILVSRQGGRLSVVPDNTAIYPHHDSRLKSPDGRYTVYDTTDDGWGRGGIDVVYPDGTTKRIFTNVMSQDLPDGQGIGGVTGYSPIQFIDNERFLYHIGGWEWTQGYGIYNLATGEKTEFREGYAAMGYWYGAIFLTKSRGYETVEWYMDTLEGGERRLLASRDKNADESAFYVESPADFRFGGTNWRTIYHINQISYSLNEKQLDINLYNLDIRKHYVDEPPNVLAKVHYDVSEAEIYTISHDNRETSIIFADDAPMPEKTADSAPIVNVVENSGGLDVKAVLLPVPKDGGYMDPIKFDKRHTLYITYEVAINEETGKYYKTNPHLYLIDILNGEIKADSPYFVEDGEDFDLFDVDYTADGIILMEMGNMGDRLGVKRAHVITLEGDTLVFSPVVVRTELYPYNSNKIVSPTGEYVVYERDEGGYGDGGIDVVYAGGAVHRILKNAPLPTWGGSLGAVSYYSPVGFADNSHLVYSIGGYESIKGFGIYDLATGENMMFDDFKYQLSIVGDGVISFEEVRRNDEGLPEQYRTWLMTLDGKMTLTASVDEADGVPTMPKNISNRLRREPFYAFTSRSFKEVPDYFYDTVSYVVESIYSPDMKEKLAVIEYPSDGNMRAWRNIYFAGNSVTVVLPVEPHIALYTNVEFTTHSFTYTNEKNPFYGYTQTFAVPSYCYRNNGGYFEPNSHLLNSEQSIFRVGLSAYEHSYKEFMAGKNMTIYDRNPITVTKDNGEIINGFVGYIDEEGTTYRTYKFYFPTEEQDKGFVLSLRERLEGDGDYYYNNIILPIVYSVKIEKTTFTQDGGKIYFTSSPTSFLPPEANSRIGDLKFDSSYIITYATADDDLCVYYSYGLDAESFIMLETEFEPADIQSYYDSEVLEPGVNEDGIVTITVRYYHIGIACYTDVTYELNPNLYVASGDPNDERVHRTPVWKAVDTTFTLHEAEVPSIIIRNNENVEFWYRFMNSSRYIYFITLRDNGNPVRVYLFHFDASNASEINTVGIQIPEDVEYDTIKPINYITGGGSMECRFYLELTKSGEVFYVSFDNFHWETGEDILDFKYKGIVPDSEIAELHMNNPELFGDPENSKIPTDSGTNTTEDVFRSILENKEKFRWDGGEAYFADLIDTRTVASAYTIIDLDGKGEAELVVSLEHVISRSGAGTLIFHREDDYVICHYLEPRYFVGLMADGSFQWSGDSGNGFAKLDFSGDSFTWVNITKRVVNDYPDINYYINDKPVTDIEYEKYQTDLLRGEYPSWIALDYSREDSDEKAIESILSNKMPIRVVARDENMLLSDYREYSGYAVKRYTVLDLDKDGGFELVLWLGFENSPYSYDYLVLHRDGDIWYAHGFTARAFNCLKQNGQYTSSSSAFNMTLLEIDFEGDSYTETKVAQRTGTGTQESIEYYVGGERASKAEFEKIYDRYDIISQPTWYSLDPDTVDDIENWRDMFGVWYPEDGSNPAPRLYDLIDELVSAKSRIPEINELGITDYTIALIMESEYEAEVRLTFTVTGNSLPETLPPGTYTWTIYEGYDVDVTDYGDIPNPDAVPSYADRTRGMEKFGDYSAARAVETYLSWGPYSYEISPYGEWDPTNYDLPYNYICAMYGDSLTIAFDDLAVLMNEKFGITVTRPERDGAILSRCRYDAAYDTVTYADTRGYLPVHKIIDVVVDGDVTYVTVQLYADRLYLIPSHKVRYKIGEGDVFLSSEIIEQGKYEPRELH